MIKVSNVLDLALSSGWQRFGKRRPDAPKGSGAMMVALDNC